MSLCDEVFEIFQKQENSYHIFGADSNATGAIERAFDSVSKNERVNALLLFMPAIDTNSQRIQKQLESLKAYHIKIEVCIQQDDAQIAFWQRFNALVWALTPL